jgi:SpoVK/Ycf46/Vps4 family AAA+-type ATPase
MDYLLEISRIIDGAMKADHTRVVAYAEQLIRKLRQAGDMQAAARLQRTLDQVATSDVMLSAAPGLMRLPVDHDSRLALADEEQLDSTDAHVILEAAVEQRVREFVQFVKASDRLMATRVGIAPTMLIYGLPGVGKTALARHIASQLDLPLITSRVDSLISSFLGSTAKNLRLLFEHARSRPCILFLDELDAIAKLRDDEHELGELKRVVVSLVQNIDALDNETVILSATNHQHLLDPAIWRRFAFRIELALPGPDARRRMIELFLKDHHSGVDADILVAMTDGLSGADLRLVCENAIRLAVIADQSQVSTTDLIRGFIRMRLGETFDFTSTECTHVRSVYKLAPDMLTCRHLAAVFDTSEPTISRRLNAEGEANGKRRKK